MNTNINNTEATNNTMTNKENTNMKRNYTRYNGIKCVETGKVYNTVAEAAKEMGLSIRCLYAVLNGTHQSIKGYHFECANSSDTKEVVIQRKAIIRGKGKSCNGNANAVLCISTGDVFTSATDAANHADVTQGHMSNVCRGNGHAVKGKKYCYVKDINEHLDEVAESIRKANMYDEFMTKEEKRKELVANVEHWESETKRIDDEIAMLFKAKANAIEELDKARHELMYFSF